MNATLGKVCAEFIPKRQQKHYSNNEGLDESAKLIADEPADIEEETPAEDNEPVEQTEPTPPEPPAFEE